MHTRGEEDYPTSVAGVEPIVARLRAAGCVFAEDEARLLLAEARTPDELDALVTRRVAGEPLEYVLGWAEFAGLRIAVEPGVFVPRRRTEFLVAQARAQTKPHAIVVDLCCGSGALGAALAAGQPDIELYAADLDPAAVRCARRNITGEVSRVTCSTRCPPTSWADIDVLLANAPYVPTDAVALMPPEAREHEARTALDGGSRRARRAPPGRRRGPALARPARHRVRRDQRAAGAAAQRGDARRRPHRRRSSRTATAPPSSRARINQTTVDLNRTAVLPSPGMWAMVVKEFRELVRDRRTMAMLIALPLILLIVFGYAANFSVSTIETELFGPQAQQLSAQVPQPVPRHADRPGRHPRPKPSTTCATTAPTS